ncbi:MAG: thymidylate synthase [Alphaproteobacteria bacterium]
MLAQVTGLKPGEFIHTLGDAHLYSNHLEQALTLARPQAAAGHAHQSGDQGHLRLRHEDFRLGGYEAHPHIAAVAV